MTHLPQSQARGREVNEQKARRIIENLVDNIGDDGSLRDLGTLIGWWPGKKTVTLEGEFTPDELKAIAWWIENMGGTQR
jgi:hypothetical protein